MAPARGSSASSSRDAAVDLDEDAVMAAIRERRPATAMQEALSLRDSERAWVLRARACVAMGSLASARRAYGRVSEANGSSSELARLAVDEKKTLEQIVLYVDTLAHMMHYFFPRQVPRADSAGDSPGSVRRDGTYATATSLASVGHLPSSASGDGEYVEIGYRLWRCLEKPQRGRAPRGVLLYFHGNGEVASDYDGQAALFNLMGLHLLVVEFRGYGWSTAAPTLLSALLSDAEPLLSDGALDAALRASGIAPGRLPVILFGRSLGSATAIHMAAMGLARFSGLVLESGIVSGSSMLAGAEDEVAEAAAYAQANEQAPKPGGGVEHVCLMEHGDKLKECRMPTLILHGTNDQIVSPSQARQAHRASGAAQKTLKLIEGAGHNEISMAAGYFEAIASFVDDVEESWAREFTSEVTRQEDLVVGWDRS